MTSAAIAHCIRRGDLWRSLLPATYLTHPGPPTERQRMIAALLYAGPDAQSQLTGRAALVMYGFRWNRTESSIDVLIPQDRQRQSRSFTRIERTWRFPDTSTVSGPIRCAPISRAVGDAVRRLRDVGAARAVVAEAVQSRRCGLDELVEELTDGPMRYSALLRDVLAEVADGVRSAAEAENRTLILRSSLPAPLFNVDLYEPDGTWLARPDAWFPDAGVAEEIDSREYHLSPADWARTLRRDARMARHGIITVHITPSRVRLEGQRVLEDLSKAVAAGMARGPVALTWRRPAA